MSTQILFNKQAREKLLVGVNIMADAVSSTLGPRGQNVAIAKSTPRGDIYERIVLHDGVSVARSIELPDEFENMGAQLLKQASQKQVDMVGDGTTVVMILARAIIEECSQIISTGINPMVLREGLEKAADILTTKLKKIALPLKSFEQMKHIATISAEDTYLGNLVAETMKKVGENGVVDVEESKNPETTVEYQIGMQIDKGYLHQLFVTNPERMEAVFEDPQVLITDKSITSLLPLAKLLNALTSDAVRRPLVIISPDISGEALPLLIQNKLEGKLFSLCIKAPSFGQDQKNTLHDIAILTGAKFITEDAGHKFEDVTVDDLGEAEYVTATKNETTVAGGRGSKESIKKQVESIKKQLEDEGTDFDKDRLKTRLGKLTDGVAVIRVGGTTEVEMKERRERLIDSISALRAAMRSGIVPGGEIVYLSILRELKEFILEQKILMNALKKPFRKLVENAGYDGGEKLSELKYQPPSIGGIMRTVYPKIKTKSKLTLKTMTEHFTHVEEARKAMKEYDVSANTGFDVTDGQFKDMISAGIVDPVEVSIQAIKNAVSVAVQIMTTGTVIVPIKDKEKQK